MTRVLYVVNSPIAFLQSRIAVAERLRGNGVEVEVATPPGEGIDGIRGKGHVVHEIPLGRGRLNPFGELETTRALTSLYRARKPDLVHHVAWKAIVHGGLAARRARVPAVVHTVAGLGYAFSSNRMRPRAIRKVLEIACRVVARHPNATFIAQNPDDERLLVHEMGLRPGQVTLIQGSGVDLSRFTVRPEPDGLPVVLLASRLLWSKGVGEFVGAAKRINDAKPLARFVLVGEPDVMNPDSIPGSTLDSWVEEGDVEWWGWRSDMPEVLASAAVVTLPSKYREGVPRVLLEAAASGRPVVTTDAPGCRETVVDGKTGLLVAPGDEGALADALRRLVSDSRERAAMGAAGRALMEAEFSVEAVVDKTIRVYDALLAGFSKEAA